MGTAIVEVVWLVGLFGKLNLQLKLPVKLFCDSKVAFQIAANPIYHERTKHIEINCHFVREKIQERLVETTHVRSGLQLADILTKGLGRTQHESLLSKLGMLILFSPHILRGSIEGSSTDS